MSDAPKKQYYDISINKEGNNLTLKVVDSSPDWKVAPTDKEFIQGQLCRRLARGHNVHCSVCVCTRSLRRTRCAGYNG
jgi:hypothetical protein